MSHSTGLAAASPRPASPRLRRSRSASPGALAAVGTVALLPLVGGCFVSTDLDGTAFLCMDDPSCPDGFVCLDGYCVLAGAGPDAADNPIDGSPGAAPDGGVPAGDFQFRQRLSFSNLDRGELAEFPVLVALDPKRIDYGALRSDGADLAFRDPDGSALPHEIERWDPKGTSLLWVRVPLVDGGSDSDFIWMYYGDPDAEVAQDPASVWTRYGSAYHLDGDDVLADSGGRGFDGASIGSEPAEGFLGLGGGREFDGFSQYVDLGNGRDFAGGVSGLTVEAWIRPFEAQEGVIFGASVNGANTSRIEFRYDFDQTIRGGMRTDPATELQAATSDQPVSIGEWTWVAVVCDLPSAEVSIYIDGEEVGSAGGLLLEGSTPDDPSDQATIGVNESLDIQFFPGLIDEVRIAPEALDPDWMSAQSASMRDQLLSFDSPESL